MTNKNYVFQEMFFDAVKDFAIENPNKSIDYHFIYSGLCFFSFKQSTQNSNNYQIDLNLNNNQEPLFQYFEYWKQKNANNPRMKVLDVWDDRHFLVFENGQIKGNEIKLYVPIDMQHLQFGVDMLFKFISDNNIEHQSKVAKYIRHDNIVIRVNTPEDAKKIMEFVSNNNYFREGLMMTNPFLPSINGVGLAMDGRGNYSYNSAVAKLIFEFFAKLRRENKLSEFNVQNFNTYVKDYINGLGEFNLDFKDICLLISKVTTPNFKTEDLTQYLNNKLLDDYNERKERITDPKYYFEKAVLTNYETHPDFANKAIVQYIQTGNAGAFTSKDQIRNKLLKYVDRADVVNIMRSKLAQNGIPMPNNDLELANSYIDVLNKQIKKENFTQDFEMIKRAYVNTMNKYGPVQANFALLELLKGSARGFTNDFGDRTKLQQLLSQTSTKKIILENIDINGLNPNDIVEIARRFEAVIGIGETSLGSKRM